jgi:hypothetical protein
MKLKNGVIGGDPASLGTVGHTETKEEKCSKKLSVY